MDVLVILLAGIVAIVGFICITELLVWIWEKLDPPTKIEEVSKDEYDNRKAA